MRPERGMAIVTVMLAVVMMTALGAALILTTSGETLIAGNFRSSAEALYAADAALELSVGDLQNVPDWTQLLKGSMRSPLIVRDQETSRTRPFVDLDAVVNLANCEKASDCTEAEMNASTSKRPWGADNPRWQVYAYGRLANLLPGGSVSSAFYVVVLVGDDPSENDGDPALDGATETNPGRGVLVLRAEAFGPRGAYKAIEMTVARADPPDLKPDGMAGVRVLSWRELK